MERLYYSAVRDAFVVREDGIHYDCKETSLSSGLDIASKRAAYDAESKRLLSEKPILARIMKACIPEYKDVPVKDIEEFYIENPQVGMVPVHRDVAPRIVGMNTEDSTITEGKVFFDILFKALLPDSNEQIELIINLEAQNAWGPRYSIVERMVYYTSRILSRQHDTEFKNDDYGKIKKVYSIWICPGAGKTYGNAMNVYRFGEYPVIGNMRIDPKHYDLATGILISINDEDEEFYEGIIRMLGVLLSEQLEPDIKKEILEKEYELNSTEKIDRRLTHMCNLSERIVQDTTIHHVIDAMRSYKVSADKALANFNIPKDERPFYKEWVEEKLKDEPIKSADLNSDLLDHSLSLSIKNLMASMECSCDKAMELLKVPEAERPVYKQWIESDSENNS